MRAIEKRATIKDVSKKSGVSISTVSRYLNQSGYVEEMTARTIQNAVDELKYKPNKIAQSLKKESTKQIVLIVPDIINPYYGTVFRTIQKLAGEDGYTVLLYDTDQDEEKEMKGAEFADELDADGVVYCSIYKSGKVIEYLERHSSHVVVNTKYSSAKFDTIYSESGKGIYIAAKHLMDCGHREIGYVGGAPMSDINTRRKKGFITAMKENGLEVKADWIFEMDFTMAAGYKAGMYFAALKERPTAICAANDIIAMGIMTAFNERQIRIPQDISLTGEDNIEFANVCRPALTTIENSGAFFAEKAYGLLLERMRHEYDGEPREIICSRELIVRESTRKMEPI